MAAWAQPASVLAVLALTPAAASAQPAWGAMPPGLLPSRLPVADAAGQGAPWRLHTEAADLRASDATPARGYAGDWADYHPRSGRNVVLQQSRLALSASRAGWELTATLRSDILITGSRGAFDLVQLYKQRSTPANGSSLAVAADELGVVWAGLRGARSWTLRPAADGQSAGLRLTAALTPLSVRRVQRVQAQGAVQYTDAAGYAFDASTLRQDSRQPFGGFGTARATGSGITSDLGLLWQPSADWFANLSLVDAASQLRIDGVATEAMQLSSATRSLDDRGYLDYRPLINGRNSTSSLRLRLLRKWQAAAGVQVQALWAGAPAGSQLGLRWERLGTLDLPAVWASLPLAPGWTVQADAETRLRTLGLGVQGPFAALMLRSSSALPGSASALGWQASVTLPW